MKMIRGGTRQTLRAAFAAVAVLVMVGAALPAHAQTNAVYQASMLRDGWFLRTWLLCGPFPNPGDGSGDKRRHGARCEGFFRDYLASMGGEAQARPRAGDTSGVPGFPSRTWTAYTAPHIPGLLQLRIDGKAPHGYGDPIWLQTLMTPADDMVAYAYCEIVSDRDQERLFGLGTDDGVRMWLNGREVWRFHAMRNIELDDDYLRLPLRRGVNRILLKLDNGYGGWGFQMRPVSDAIAQATILRDARVRLAPRFWATGGTVYGVFGVARSTRAVRGMDAGIVTVRTASGRRVLTRTMPIGHTVSWPRSAFPTGERLHADIAFRASGAPVPIARTYVPTTDVVAAAKQRLAASYPNPPDSRRARALHRFIADMRRLEGRDRLAGEAYAYERLAISLDRVRQQLHALGAATSTPYDGLFPCPRRITVTRGATCAIDRTWSLALPGDLLPAPLQRSLSDAWEQRLGAPLARSERTGARTIAVSIAGRGEPVRDLERSLPRTADAFAIRVERDRVRILARSAAGAAYALDTFAQLVEQTRPIPCGVVVDWPTFPVRSVCELKDPFSEQFRSDIETYARLRYNQVMVYGDYSRLTDPAHAARMRAVFAFCRERFIEPLPAIETFGGGSAADAVDSDMVEGVQALRRPFVVGADRTVRLVEPRILDTVTVHPSVEDASGRPLTRETQWVLVSKVPPVFRFTESGPRPGDRVRITYDWHNPKLFRFGASCPSDPRRWPYLDAYIGRIFSELGGDAIHLGQDEGGTMNRDSRCLARHTTARKLMAEQFRRTYEIVRRHRPGARIYLWGDEFNPYQNAPILGGPDSGDDLPKDVIVVDWAYGGNSYPELEHLDRSAAYFARKQGLRIITAAWDNPFNIARLTSMRQKFGPRLYTGLMHCAWEDNGPAPEGRELTAQGAWEGRTMIGEFEF